MKKITPLIREGIQAIVDRYPVESGQCSQCAREIYDLLTAEGFTAQIGRMETKLRFLMLADGTQLSYRPPRSNSLAYHEFVKIEDIVYDAVTGSQGMSVSDYKNLFYEGVFDDGSIHLAYISP